MLATGYWFKSGRGGPAKGSLARCSYAIGRGRKMRSAEEAAHLPPANSILNLKREQYKLG